MKVMVSEGSFEGVASIEGMVSVKGVLRDTFFFFFFLRFLSGMLFGLFSTWHEQVCSQILGLVNSYHCGAKWFCSLEEVFPDHVSCIFFSHIHHCVLQAIMNHTWLNNIPLTPWKTHHSGAAEGNQPSFYSLIPSIFFVYTNDGGLWKSNMIVSMN